METPRFHANVCRKHRKGPSDVDDYLKTTLNVSNYLLGGI